MNRKLIVLPLLLVALLAIGVAFPAFTNYGYVRGTLNLYEKDPETWVPIRLGGILYYSEFGSPEFSFYLVAWGLKPETDYSLIVYHPDDWDTSLERFVIAEVTTDWYGRIRSKGSVVFPENLVFRGIDVNPEAEFIKIWLVLSSDLSDSKLTKFNPTEWLFEASLITFYGAP